MMTGRCVVTIYFDIYFLFFILNDTSNPGRWKLTLMFILILLDWKIAK